MHRQMPRQLIRPRESFPTTNFNAYIRSVASMCAKLQKISDYAVERYAGSDLHVLRDLMILRMLCKVAFMN